MVTLDTNAILRFITGDLPKEAKMVEDLINSNEDLFIPEVIFPELEYNLSRGYQYSRRQLVKSFKFLLGLSNIDVPVSVRVAFKLFEASRLDMADCIIAAYAKGEKLASFDKELLSVSGVRSYWKND